MAEQATFKQRIRRGDKLFGAGVPMTATAEWLQEVVQRRPYDFVSVDAQHSPFDEDRLVAFCAAAREAGVPVLFRIKHTRHTYLIGNYLDLGPHAIEVPQVELQSTVDEAVANFYYPPRGVRSWGGAARVGIANRSLDDYPAFWERTGALAMQIESLAATTAARSLAKDGVDFLTFGPADLSFSLESNDHHTLKTVDDCVRHVAAELADTDVQVCMRIAPGDDPSKYHDMGVTMLLEAGVR